METTFVGTKTGAATDISPIDVTESNLFHVSSFEVESRSSPVPSASSEYEVDQTVCENMTETEKNESENNVQFQMFETTGEMTRIKTPDTMPTLSPIPTPTPTPVPIPTPSQTFTQTASCNPWTTDGLKAIGDLAEMKVGGETVIFYNTQMATNLVTVDFVIGNADSRATILFKAWYEQIPTKAKVAFTAILDADGDKLWKMVDDGYNGTGDNYLDHYFMLNGYSVYMHYYDNVGQLMIAIDK